VSTHPQCVRNGSLELSEKIREGSQKSADPCNEKRVVKMELTAVKANVMSSPGCVCYSLSFFSLAASIRIHARTFNSVTRRSSLVQ